MILPAQDQPTDQRTKFNLGQLRPWIKQITTSKIFRLQALVLVVLLLILAAGKVQFLEKVKNKVQLTRRAVHTRFCGSLATGVPQEKLTPEQESRFGKISGEPPRCGDTLTFSDAKTKGPASPASTAINIIASGFQATDCNRAEITLRLTQAEAIVWKKTEIDSSCSSSAEGKPRGNYVIRLEKPGSELPLEGSELEVCFDLINKSGRRASQNPTSTCEILAFTPYLCQKIPIPNGWR